MFEWNSRYSVQISTIDIQHEKLFAIAQELYGAMSSGQGKAVVGKILDRLITFTSAHFAHEERLMQERRYPDFARHKAQHDALRAQVVKFRSDYQSGKAAMTVQLLQFLREWLTCHIQDSDQRYAPFLRS